MSAGPPGRRTAGYELTETGRGLREPILGLARFGLRVGEASAVPACLYLIGLRDQEALGWAA